MMNDWYERSMKTLQLAGLAERSQQSFTRMVRMLVDFYDKTPDLISEEELQEYFLHRRNVDKWSSGTLRIGNGNEERRRIDSDDGAEIVLY